MSAFIRAANSHDAAAIARVLHANRADPSLFQQPPRRIRRNVREFLVACDDDGRVVACLQVAHHTARSSELLAVAVHPDHQGRGLGSRLVRAGIQRARGAGAELVWLGSAKPSYFARLGFSPFSRWRLPLWLLLHKLYLVTQQPLERWLPAIFGRHVFMRLAR